MTGSVPEARKYSLKLLALRGRSEKELRERLAKKGFEAEEISSAVDYLKKAGLIDDGILAEELKRHAFEIKLYGYEAAKRFMRRRGLSMDVVESALDYDEDRELSNLRRLLHKKMKYGGGDMPPSERRKIWNFLLRRGYSAETIGKALKYPDDTEEA